MKLVEVLGKVGRHLDKGNDEAALSALLTAWRSVRHPRLAELVDRVAAPIDAARGPIKGKTVKARTEAWMKVAAEKDPADLGRLLATPWPGTWQPALPVLRAVLAFPDDPRMAMAFARIVDETPYDTWTCKSFYAPLFTRLQKLGDPRTAPLLESQLSRQKGYYYQAAMRPLEQKAAEALKKVAVPKLEADAEKALAALEARYSGEVRTEKARARGEAEFLADIYQNPDDDSLRMVFADWLSERGDPRGELIALQLSSEEAAHKKASTLVRKHGEAWAGAIGRVLSPKRRVFERGFLSCAQIHLEGRKQQLPVEFSDPAWATVRRLAITVPWEPLAAEIVQLPSMRFVRGFVALEETAAWALAEGPPRPRIEELEIIPADSPNPARRAKLLSGEAFPSLHTLSIETHELDDLEWLFPSKLAKRARTFRLRNYEYPIGPVLAAIERHGLTPDAVILSERTHIDEWVLTLRRDERGRFGALHCGWDDKMPSPYDLVRALQSLPDDALTSFTVDASRNSTWDRNYIRMAEEALARFTTLKHVDVPWERLSIETEEGSALGLYLSGTDLWTPASLPKIWALVHAPPFSLGLDAYEVNHSKHTSFGKDPLHEMLEVLGKKRTSSVRAYRKNAEELASLRLTSSGKSLELSVPEGDLDAWLALLVKLLDLGKVESGRVSFRDVDEEGDETERSIDLDPPFERDDPSLGFVTIFGPGLFVPHDALAATFERFGYRTLRSKRNLVVIAGTRTPPRDTVGLQQALCETFWSAHREKRGFVVAELVREIVGPALEARGFHEVPLPEPKRAWGAILYRQAHPEGARGLHLQPWFPAYEAELEIEARHCPGAPDADLIEKLSKSDTIGEAVFAAGDSFSAKTEKSTRAALTKLVGWLDGPVAEWFVPKPEKRRR